MHLAQLKTLIDRLSAILDDPIRRRLLHPDTRKRLNRQRDRLSIVLLKTQIQQQWGA